MEHLGLSSALSARVRFAAYLAGAFFSDHIEAGAAAGVMISLHRAHPEVAVRQWSGVHDHHVATDSR